MSVKDVFKSMDYGPAPESPEAVKAWLAEHDGSFGLFINNRWVRPDSAETYPSTNPATGEKLAETVQAGQEEVDAAVAAARKAYKTWSKTPGHERARYLYALARNIQKHHRLLAVLESMDNGKPIRESRDIDVPLLARHFYYYAGWAQLMESELREYQPVGVIGQIIPWNFPLLMLAWKIAPAIAMGNTVVLKPASYTRLTALLFAEVVAEAGIPPGVINVLTGSSKAGSMIVTPARGKRYRWNWAANPPSLCLMMPTWTARSKALSMRSGSIKARFAVLDRVCLFRRMSPMPSLRS